jgi:hypothetical protein
MLAQFTWQLIAGISLMWVLMPRRQVTSGFFRIQMLLVLGLAVLATLVLWETAPAEPIEAAESTPAPPGWLPGVGLVVAGLAFLGSILWTLERRKAGAICGFLIAGLGQAAVGAIFQNQLEPNWLGLLSAGTTASVLGGSVTGMLLGHWYLTAPTMSIAPLSRLTEVYGVAVGLRLLVSGIGLVQAASELDGSLLWTWLALRWLAGIAGPLVLCGMTLRILRYRNTQAATGVLFAAVILTFIGELAGSLLSRELGRPF